MSALSPFRNGMYRLFWGAYLAANLSLWMNDVAAAWLMTTMSTDPILVALVQTASALPVFLLALPSGAIADIVDRRLWFMATQLWVTATAVVLALAAWTDLLSASLLLALVFANGVGFAMRWPVFSAIVPELVPRQELPQALALNSIAVNLSRIAGPVTAGALLASLGSAYVFALNAILSLATVVVIGRWRNVRQASALPGERFVGALRVGLQYVAQSPSLRRVLLRVFVFYLQTTAIISLLPLVAKALNGGAGIYTLLLSCLGFGAIVAGLSMARLRRRFDVDTVVNGGTVLHALCTVALAFAPNVWIAAVVIFPAGAAWIAVANSLTVSAQMVLPDWVRARGMAIFIMSVMGGSAAGAALWGAVARYTNIGGSLLLSSAVALALLLVLGRRRTIDQHDDEDVAPHHIVYDPDTVLPMASGIGPVMVTIEYFIDPDDEVEFFAIMEESRRSRLRGGALSWGLLRDAADSRRHVEYFVDESWVEHLRRIDRLTTGDARLRERRMAFHKGSEPPRVTRFVGQSVGR